MIDPTLTKLAYNAEALQGLRLFIDERVEYLKESLVLADLDQIKFIQGGIAELKKLKDIDKVIISKRKQENGQSN